MGKYVHHKVIRKSQDSYIYIYIRGIYEINFRDVYVDSPEAKRGGRGFMPWSQVRGDGGNGLVPCLVSPGDPGEPMLPFQYEGQQAGEFPGA